MTAHRKSGRGFPEVVYQWALAVELFEQRLRAKREIELPIHYDNEKIGSHRADFFVGEWILVEVKAVAAVLPAHHVQTINYLEAFKILVGPILNFGVPTLEYKRFIETKK